MKYERTAGVVKREIAGEIFLVPVKQRLADMQNLFVLHGCAEFVWDQLGVPLSKDAVAAKISESYDVSVEDAERDADAFIAELADAELVRAAG